MSESQESTLFEKCVENGITINNVEQPFYSQKLKTLAISLGIEMEESPKDFLSRMNHKSTQAQKYLDETQKKSEFIQLQKEDKALSKQLSKYSDLYGIDKPVALITDEYDKKIQIKLKEYESAMQEVYKYKGYAQTSLQVNDVLRGKERDWAIAGGIASGIAGSAAGVASALDAQAYNASVRASNAALDHQTAQELVLISQFETKAKQRADKIREQIQELENTKNREIEDYKTKVVGEQSDEEVFSYLAFNNIYSYINKTGSVSITAKVRCTSACNVFGNTNAHVDGSLTAQVFQEGHLIGVADLVCPVTGIPSYEITLKGISLCNATLGENCKIIISPKNLWAVEN